MFVCLCDWSWAWIGSIMFFEFTVIRPSRLSQYLLSSCTAFLTEGQLWILNQPNQIRKKVIQHLQTRHCYLLRLPIPLLGNGNWVWMQPSPCEFFQSADWTIVVPVSLDMLLFFSGEATTFIRLIKFETMYSFNRCCQGFSPGSHWRKNTNRKQSLKPWWWRLLLVMVVLCIPLWKRLYFSLDDVC